MDFQIETFDLQITAGESAVSPEHHFVEMWAEISATNNKLMKLLEIK